MAVGMGPGISKRGEYLANYPRPAFLKPYYEAVKDGIYHPTERPDAAVNLCLAENRQSIGMVSDRLEGISGATADGLTYNTYQGNPELRRVLAAILTRIAGGAVADPDNLHVVNGAGPALLLLSLVLCDDHDSILIPVPFYYSFDRDMGVWGKVALHPVNPVGEAGPFEPEALEAAFCNSQSQGHRPRVLLLTNPNNPTGEVISAETVLRASEWARQKGLHLISDEAYALSVFRNEPVPFRSVLDLYASSTGTVRRVALPPHVHMVYTLSKDFCMSGVRCGVLYTENRSVAEAVAKYVYFFQVAGTAQQQLREVLGDGAWVDRYLVNMRRKLLEVSQVVENRLSAAGIPYQKPQGGFFVWVDLRKWLPHAGSEQQLFTHLTKRKGGGVILCPGEACCAPEPGWFRLCFTASPVKDLIVGLDRLCDTMHSMAAAKL